MRPYLSEIFSPSLSSSNLCVPVKIGHTKDAGMRLRLCELLVRPEGFEPPTSGLGIRCSILLSYGRTTRQIKERTRQIGAPRFELGTSCSQGRRANQAALRPDSIKKTARFCNRAGIPGSPGRTRTADKVVNSHLLYQLSYRGLEDSEEQQAWLLVEIL